MFQPSLPKFYSEDITDFESFRKQGIEEHLNREREAYIISRKVEMELYNSHQIDTLHFNSYASIEDLLNNLPCGNYSSVVEYYSNQMTRERLDQIAVDGPCWITI